MRCLLEAAEIFAGQDPNFKTGRRTYLQGGSLHCPARTLMPPMPPQMPHYFMIVVHSRMTLSPRTDCNCAAQVRATAVLGVPQPERLVYDNLDLLVHPMSVSFTDEQLNQLWVRALCTTPFPGPFLAL